MSSELDDQLRSEVEPIVSGMGFTLVELRHNRSRNQNHIIIVVHHPAGVGVDECAAISRNLRPRLELIEGLENMQLQVSSPGLDRTFKGEHEYSIFSGRNVKIMLRGDTEWLRGTLQGAADGKVTLNMEGKSRTMDMAEIRKTKLDS